MNTTTNSNDHTVTTTDTNATDTTTTDTTTSDTSTTATITTPGPSTPATGRRRGHRTRRVGAGVLTTSIAASAVVAFADTGAAQAAPSSTPELPDIAAFVEDFISGAPLDSMPVATGRQLKERNLHAHLHDDREYYFVQLEDGLEINLPQIEGLDVELLPPTTSFAPDEPVVVVVDPTDPYVYFGGPCPTVKPPPDQRKGTKHAAKRNEHALKGLLDVALHDDDRLKLIESDFVGAECGIGLSANGNIPIGDAALGDNFAANVVVDGETRAHPAVKVDGALFANVGVSGLRAAAHGKAELSVPFVDALVEMAIPLGEARVDLQLDDRRIGLDVAGTVEVKDTHAIPLLGVPLTLPGNGAASIAMRLGAVSDGSNWVVDPDSFLQIDGKVGVGLGALGRTTGLDLHDIAGAQVSARVDRTGARVTGRADLDIHPAVSTGANAAFDLMVDATDFSKSRLAFDADVTVAGTRLAAADVQLSTAGLRVAGSTRLGGLSVDVGGRITPTGADISGRTSVQFSLDAINSIVSDARAGITTARREIRSINAKINKRRGVVRAERAARDRGLRNAIAAVSAAKDKVDDINDTIAYNNRLISARRTWIRNEINRYNRLAWWQRTPWALADHAAKLAAWNGQIAAWEAANATQRTLRDGAKAALSGAERLVSEVRTALSRANVDDDLQIRGLFASRQVQTDLLNTLEQALRQVNVRGTVRGDIAVTLGTSGLNASLSARYCDGGSCTTLTGGRVRIGNPTTACVDVLGLGEACVRL